MLETTAEIVSRSCVVQMLKGEWPKPINDHRWLSDRAILTMMFVPPSYGAEGHYSTSPKFEPIGHVFFVPPDRELIGRGSGGEVQAFRCVFNMEDDQELATALRSLSGAQLNKTLDVRSTTVTLLMNRLIQETASPGFASKALIEAIGSTLLIESVRQLCGYEVVSEELDKGGLKPRHLRMIDDYLDTLDAGSPTVSDIAQLCGFSAHYFCKLFRQHTGQSLGRYLAESRIRRAERMLVETDLPLKEIAFRLGFANPANFSTAFRNGRKQSPGAFRNEKRIVLFGATKSEKRSLH